MLGNLRGIEINATEMGRDFIRQIEQSILHGGVRVVDMGVSLPQRLHFKFVFSKERFKVTIIIGRPVTLCLIKRLFAGKSIPQSMGFSVRNSDDEFDPALGAKKALTSSVSTSDPEFKLAAFEALFKAYPILKPVSSKRNKHNEIGHHRAEAVKKLNAANKQGKLKAPKPNLKLEA